MRRLHLGVLAAVVPALLLSLALVGCGGKEEKGTTDGGKPAEGGKKAPAATKGIEPGTGTLKGKVVLEGSPPDTKKETEALLDAIGKKTDDKTYCLSAPEDQKIEQAWRIGDNKQVGNVFVWLEPADRSEFFKISDEQLKAVPKEVDIDQPFCAFVPHCLILFPKYRDPKDPKKFKETGQKFVVKNDAKISHNTKLEAGPKNPEFNQTLEKGSHKDVPTLEPYNDEIKVRCGIHPWMSASARAFDHPYAALTFSADDPKSGKIDKANPKFGTYEIKNVPQGKVRVIAWHEKAGYLGKGARGEEITLTGGDNTKDFTISAK